MKKKLLPVLFLAVLVLMLSACGKEPPEETTQIPTATQQAPTRPAPTQPKPTETQPETQPETEPETQADNDNALLQGTYYYELGSISVEFDGVDSFVMEDPETTWEGSYLLTDGHLYLLGLDGEDMSALVTEEGYLQFDGTDGYFTTTEPDDRVLLGVWHQYQEDLTVRLYENGDFFASYWGDFYRYTFVLDDNYILLFDGDTMIDRAEVLEDGKMMFDSRPDQWLLPQEQDPECVSDAYELESNWVMDGGMERMENGARWRNEDEGLRGIMPSEWQASLISDETDEDGRRTMEFMAISGLPTETTPSNSGTIYTRWSMLYDYDTGEILLKDNDYSEETGVVGFDHPQGYVELEFSVKQQKAFKEEAQENGYQSLMCFDITVTMPEWYHGLMMSALAFDLEIEDDGWMNVLDDSLYPYIANGLRLNVD